MKIFKIIIIFLFFVFIPVIAMADIIYLVDGSSIEGEIIEVSNDSITIRTENGIFEIPKNKILKIEFISDENDDDMLRERIKKALEKLKNEINNFITIVITVDDFNFNFNFNFNWNNNDDWSNNNDDWSNNNDDWSNNNDDWSNNNDDWSNNNDDWSNNNDDWSNNNDDWNNNNNWSDDYYNWSNDNNGEGNHHYVKVGKDLIFSVGYVSLFDPFYAFDQPFYQFGVNVRLSELNSPFSFVASINLAYNVFIDYPNFGTILAYFWNIYSVGGEIRIPNLIVTPFAGLSIGIHHLYIPIVDAPSNHYGTPAFTIYGGVEFSIKDLITLQLYLKKNISLSNENFSWGFYYDQNFYDALFGYFQIGFNIYFNINL